MQSTKPYLIRAIYEWCTDQGFTPYLAVLADGRARVPQQYVKDGQIVLNVGSVAAHQLNMGSELITFSARFSGVAQSLSIPVECVLAIYARENGHGMAFELEQSASVDELEAGEEPAGRELGTAEDSEPEPDKPPPSRPHLVRVK